MACFRCWSFELTSMFIYDAQYHRSHCTLHAFEQSEYGYKHILDDKHLIRLGFELSTSEFRVIAELSEPNIEQMTTEQKTYVIQHDSKSLLW